MPLFDSHCHLQDERVHHDLEAVLNRADAAGVAGFLCCATEEKDWPEVLALAQHYPFIIPALGLHPWYLDHVSSGWEERLRSLLITHPQAAVGEIGLDHALESRDDTFQESIFLTQLKIAGELHRPVSMHCRRAWGNLIGILDHFPQNRPPIIIHSYSGSSDMIKPLADRGVYFSFSCSLTRPANRRGQAAALAVPWSRLLIETDAPDIPPDPSARFEQQAPWGPDNEPANLVFIAQALAQIRQTDYATVMRHTWANSGRLFRIDNHTSADTLST